MAGLVRNKEVSGCSRGNEEDGTNLGGISKQKSAEFDNEVDTSNRGVRETEFSAKMELLSLKFLQTSDNESEAPGLTSPRNLL